MTQTIKQVISISLFILVLVAGMVFFVKNSQDVEFSYVLGTITLPLSILILLGFVAGAMLGLLSLIPVLLRQRLRLRELQKQVQVLEQEVNNLRVMPVKDRP